MEQPGCDDDARERTWATAPKTWAARRATREALKNMARDTRGGDERDEEGRGGREEAEASLKLATRWKWGRVGADGCLKWMLGVGVTIWPQSMRDGTRGVLFATGAAMRDSRRFQRS